MKKITVLFFLFPLLFGGCQNIQNTELADGSYIAEFITDSSMFYVNEANEGKGTLTVENGKMVIHISLGSKNILNLYSGFAEDAENEKNKENLLFPTEDNVVYPDGITEEVYGFDVPVPALETEFPLALIGKKGKWYDHMVCVSNPIAIKDDLEDGTYNIEITLEGGSGKATILSPAILTIIKGQASATIEWNSPNYDYMIVDEKKYFPINTEGNSVFKIPVSKFDEPILVIGNTVAMSNPHEIEYQITFHSNTIDK